MAGQMRPPTAVCGSDTDPVQIADAVFLKIRRLPHAPANVYVRMGGVYVLSQVYRITQFWDAAYPESFVGSLTRMERPAQIERKLRKALEEPEAV